MPAVVAVTNCTTDLVNADAITRGAMPDPKADYWTIDDVAEFWEVKPETVRTYRARKRAYMPPPDRMIGRTPVWKPRTIIDYQRPGRGYRSDLLDKAKGSEGDAAPNGDAATS
jgi:hypothetical protein